MSGQRHPGTPGAGLQVQQRDGTDSGALDEAVARGATRPTAVAAVVRAWPVSVLVLVLGWAAVTLPSPAGLASAGSVSLLVGFAGLSGLVWVLAVAVELIVGSATGERGGLLTVGGSLAVLGAMIAAGAALQLSLALTGPGHVAAIALIVSGLVVAAVPGLPRVWR